MAGRLLELSRFYKMFAPYLAFCLCFGLTDPYQRAATSPQHGAQWAVYAFPPQPRYVDGSIASLFYLLYALGALWIVVWLSLAVYKMFDVTDDRGHKA